MASSNLLDALESLPAAPYEEAPLVDIVQALDRDVVSLEVASAAEQPARTLFSSYNVPDELFQAYASVMPSADTTLYQHYGALVERGPEAVQGCINLLKGKLAEIYAERILESQFPAYDFQIAASPTQPVWD